MGKKTIIITLLVVILIVCISFLIGTFYGIDTQKKELKQIISNAIGDMMNNDISLNGEESDIVLATTFYATVLDINNIKTGDGKPIILVEELSSNGSKSGEQYYIIVKDNIIVTYKNNYIDIYELNIGDTISIMFTDEVLHAISPCPISETVWIERLGD